MSVNEIGKKMNSSQNPSDRTNIEFSFPRLLLYSFSSPLSTSMLTSLAESIPLLSRTALQTRAFSGSCCFFPLFVLLWSFGAFVAFVWGNNKSQLMFPTGHSHYMVSIRFLFLYFTRDDPVFFLVSFIFLSWLCSQETYLSPVDFAIPNEKVVNFSFSETTMLAGSPFSPSFQFFPFNLPFFSFFLSFTPQSLKVERCMDV